LFIINCKNYEEISGTKLAKFIKNAKNVSKSTKVKIIVCPPSHLLSDAAKLGLELAIQVLSRSP